MDIFLHMLINNLKSRLSKSALAYRKSRKYGARVVEAFWLSLRALVPHQSYSFEVGGKAFVETWRDYRRLRNLEPETVGWITEYVKPGDVFYDIGANVGQFSFLAEQQGAQVIAFEPFFENGRTLSRNVLLNKSKVIPVIAALSNTTSFKPFSISSLESGSARHILGRNTNSLSVMSLTLDDFIKFFHVPPPTHLKIDVDDSEHLVLQGAQETLRGVSSIMLEINDRNSIAPYLTDFSCVWSKDKFPANSVWVRKKKG